MRSRSLKRESLPQASQTNPNELHPHLRLSAIKNLKEIWLQLENFRQNVMKCLYSYIILQN